MLGKLPKTAKGYLLVHPGRLKMSHAFCCHRVFTTVARRLIRGFQVGRKVKEPHTDYMGGRMFRVRIPQCYKFLSETQRILGPDLLVVRERLH